MSIFKETKELLIEILPFFIVVALLAIAVIGIARFAEYLYSL